MNVRVCVMLPVELVERMDERCESMVVGRPFLVKRGLEMVLGTLDDNDQRQAAPTPKRKWWRR